MSIITNKQRDSLLDQAVRSVLFSSDNWVMGYNARCFSVVGYVPQTVQSEVTQKLKELEEACFSAWDEGKWKPYNDAYHQAMKE